MGKPSGKYKVTDYRLTIHYMFALQLDSIRRVLIKDEQVWPAPGTPTGFVEDTLNGVGDGDYTIINRELFGGDKKEGGVDGRMIVFLGGDDQEMPEFIADKYGVPVEDMPGFRGTTSVFFTAREETQQFNPLYSYTTQAAVTQGATQAIVAAVFSNGPTEFPNGWGDGAPSKPLGFMFTQNNPYVPAVELEGTFIPPGPSGQKAAIDMGNDAQLEANPADAIYYLMTTDTTGYGVSPLLIEESTFTLAAAQLAAENFGISFGWYKQASVEKLVQEILNHIKAVLFTNPRTGKFELKLLRGDYDVADVLANAPRYDPTNCDAVNRQRVTLEETVNEVVVEFTDPETEDKSTVSLQNIANIAVQRGVVSSAQNYYMIRRPELAQFVCARDLRELSSPLRSAQLLTDRKSWDRKPGDIIVWSWPDDGFEDLICRVLSVDFGTKSDSRIKIDISEDIYGRGSAKWSPPNQTLWVRPGANPEPLAASQVFTAPYPLAVLQVGDVSNATYPVVAAALLGASAEPDTVNYDAATEIPDAAGTLVAEVIGTYLQDALSSIAPALTFVPSSAIGQLGAATGTGTGLRPGTLLLLGMDGPEDRQEICMVQAFDEAAQSLTVSRGMYDTIPRAWPAASPAWVVNPGFLSFDTSARSAGEVATYRLLPRTSRGRLAYDSATDISATLTERPYLPFRPANFKIDGVDTGEIDGTAATDFAVTWATRNRQSEDTMAPKWDDAPAVPEAGQTTVLEFYSLSGTVLGEVAGLAGNSYTLTVAEMPAAGKVVVRAVSERDGFRSLQGHEIVVLLNTGYGYGYGTNYGN